MIPLLFFNLESSHNMKLVVFNFLERAQNKINIEIMSLWFADILTLVDKTNRLAKLEAICLTLSFSSSLSLEMHYNISNHFHIFFVSLQYLIPRPVSIRSCVLCRKATWKDTSCAYFIALLVVGLIYITQTSWEPHPGYLPSFK